MTTQTHTPTPISKRMATIATRKGWSDLTHYGDTDYGLKQHFGNSTTQTAMRDELTTLFREYSKEE
jgi:hypothetical protein